MRTLSCQTAVYLWVFYVASCAISSCGTSLHLGNKKPNKKTEEEHILVAGDPMILLQGTTRDNTSFISKDNFKSFDGYYLANLKFFVDSGELEKKGAYSGYDYFSGKARDAYIDHDLKFRFRENDNEFLYTSDVDTKDVFSLNFTSVGNAIKLTSYSRARYPVEMIHYSQKDGIFSVLFKSYDEKYKVPALVAAFFVKELVSPPVLDLAESRYSYLEGQGIRSVWRHRIQAMDLTRFSG